jgi:hypothetical protein
LFGITAIADVQSESPNGDGVPKAKRVTFSKYNLGQSKILWKLFYSDPNYYWIFVDKIG